MSKREGREGGKTKEQKEKGDFIAVFDDVSGPIKGVFVRLRSDDRDHHRIPGIQSFGNVFQPVQSFCQFQLSVSFDRFFTNHVQYGFHECAVHRRGYARFTGAVPAVV